MPGCLFGSNPVARLAILVPPPEVDRAYRSMFETCLTDRPRFSMPAHRLGSDLPPQAVWHLQPPQPPPLPSLELHSLSPLSTLVSGKWKQSTPASIRESPCSLTVRRAWRAFSSLMLLVRMGNTLSNASICESSLLISVNSLLI